MMVLLNNWDVFKKNNRVLHDKSSGEDHYTVTDLGATLGAAGGIGSRRSKNNVQDFERQRLVRKVENGKVKFDYDLKPKKFGLLSMVWPPYFFRQRRATNSMQKVPALLVVGKKEAAERTAVPGVATGLAVTGTGGDVLFVEATTMKGKDGLVLTGQLGDVMKESARIALSYVRSHADELGIDGDSFDERAFHVHVPAGAIPKDGPSAGITMTTAIASLLSGRPVKHTVGMTGEVTLQGRVLPIGGLKQKVLAAHAAGLTDVIIPERNRADLDDVPEDVKAEMSFHPVMTLDEVLALALEPAPAHALP